MRRLAQWVLLLLFAAGAAGQNGSTSAPRTLPEATADKIVQVDQRLAQLRQDIQTLELLRDNLVLMAAIEMSLSKKDLEGMELGKDGKGRPAFVQKPQPASKAPER